MEHVSDLSNSSYVNCIIDLTVSMAFSLISLMTPPPTVSSAVVLIFVIGNFMSNLYSLNKMTFHNFNIKEIFIRILDMILTCTCIYLVK